MGKKCNCPPPGAPEWVMTYGDMMSLLLTFFILLVALSEIKKEERYQLVIEEVQKAFGIRTGGGKIPIKDDPTLSLMERLENLQVNSQTHRRPSNTDDPGIDGKEPQVTRVREGMLITQGGLITFEPGSSDLSQRAKNNLLSVADLIRGYNNKIELRGHAASMELGPNSDYVDLWNLSYARARSVMAFLTGQEIGIRPDRIRLVANADREPLAKRVYTAGEQQPNRRAEVLVTESLIEDFTTPDPGS